MNKLVVSRLFPLILCGFMVSACQVFKPEPEPEPQVLAPPPPQIIKQPTPYIDYYLHLKQLSVAELQHEVDTQRKASETGDMTALLYLSLLYSLPNSPVKNPHRALKLLNEQMQNNEDLSDAGWLVALQDQLSEQVQLLNKRAASAKQAKINKQRTEQEFAKLSNQIETQMQQIIQLEMQLEQLRKIEKTIGQRENVQQH